MGQTRGDVFRFYVNQIVDVDTQSIFLETPSRNALLKLSSNSGLTRDPSAPQHLNDEQKNSIRKNPEILELEHQRDRSRKGIIAKYGKICLSRGTPEHTEYNMIMREVRAKRKQLEKATLDQTYEEFFNNIGNQIIEANFRGNPLCFTPQTSTVLPERKELADLEFKNRDASTVSDEELLEDRIKSLEMRLHLYKIQIPRPLQTRFKTANVAVENKFPDPFPPKSVSGLQCPYCLGTEYYHPLIRQYEYARKDSLKIHFQTHEAGMDFSGGRTCDYPNCNVRLRSLAHYKSHQAMVHNIYL